MRQNHPQKPHLRSTHEGAQRGRARICSTMRWRRSQPSRQTCVRNPWNANWRFVEREICKTAGQGCAEVEIRVSFDHFRNVPRVARHRPNCWPSPTATMQTGCSLITRSAASAAHLCTTAPVPASSWRTIRHRLNFAGNRALHMIVIVRLRYRERTRSYTDRRLAQGKTKKEALRNQAGTSGSDWCDGLSLACPAAGGEQDAQSVVAEVAEASC